MQTVIIQEMVQKGCNIKATFTVLRITTVLRTKPDTLHVWTMVNVSGTHLGDLRSLWMILCRCR